MKEHAYAIENLQVAKYVQEIFQPVDAELQRIIDRTKAANMPEIQLSGMDGRHLEILARLRRPEKIVEIGVLAGYSAVCLLRGAGPRAKLFALEKESSFAEVARASFVDCNVSSQVEIHVGDALGNLGNITEQGPFDMVFIDADKKNYPQYLDWAIANTKSGSVVIGDNTFAFGTIYEQNLENKNSREIAEALRAFNAKIADRDLFTGTIFPTGEGLTVGVRV